MSVPNVLRWAGVWSSVRTYTYGDTVQSVEDDLPYANIVENATTTGGTDPSTNPTEWIEVPQSGGAGVSSIIAGTGISVDQSTGDVTVTNTGGGGGAAGNATNVQYKAADGTFAGTDEFVYDPVTERVIVGEETTFVIRAALGIGAGGGTGADGQVLTSTETGLEWTTLVEPPVYTAGTGIDIDENNVISNIGTLSLNGCSGAVSLSSANIGISPDVLTGIITLTAEAPPTLIAGTGITVGIAPNYTITNTEPAIVYTAGAGIKISLGNAISATGEPDEGVKNKLQIVSTATGQVSSTVYYTGAGGVGTPSTWIPDATTYQPIAGGTLNGWRNFKEVGTSGVGTKVAWYPYNPFYGQSLPYTVAPIPAFKKSDLKSVWAIITTQNKINTQGQIFFNIFTYDIDNPPTPPLFFTNRYDYSIFNYTTLLGAAVNANTITTLNGGFRYLICAVDALPISPPTLQTVNATAMVTGTTYTILVVGNTNWTAIGAAVAAIGCVFVKNATAATGNGTGTTEINTSILIANGQEPSQSSQKKLRDPYDVEVTIPHIPFTAVAVASNAPQPADPSQIMVSAIAISSNSGSVTPTLDWTVESIGWSANNGVDTENYSYTLQYTP